MSADPGVPTGPVPGIRQAAKRPGTKTGDMAYEVAIPWSHLAPFQPAP